MPNETAFEKILIIDGKVRADILVEYLRDHDIPSYSQSEEPLACGNGSSPGESIYVGRGDVRAARMLLEAFFREESAEEEAASEYRTRSRLRRRLLAAAALAVLAAFFIYSIYGYIIQLL